MTDTPKNPDTASPPAPDDAAASLAKVQPLRPSLPGMAHETPEEHRRHEEETEAMFDNMPL